MFGFLRAGLGQAFRGSPRYRLWLALLTILVLIGLPSLWYQFRHGLGVTGMSDEITWGLYIANFTFLAGLATAAVMIVIPTCFFHHEELYQVLLLAMGLAIATSVMCLLFVAVDIGQPLKSWHLIPFIGRLNWPHSLLAWDVIALNGYLILNLAVSGMILYRRFRGEQRSEGINLGLFLLITFWAIGLHTVTAFLFSVNPARPFWNTPLLAPRFIASAFTSGSAFMILAFRVVDHFTSLQAGDKAGRYLALVMTISLQLSLFMVGAELFHQFYVPTADNTSARYLYFGLGAHDEMVLPIRAALVMQVAAMIILMVEALRRNPLWQGAACILAIIGVWVEKGMGLVIPGQVPSPLGEVVSHPITFPETMVCLSIWAFGCLLFTLMARVAIAIEAGTLRQPSP